MSLRKGNTLISGTGIDGQDGFSPSASVSKIGSVSTLIVTDKNGTTTSEILDGGQIIQYVTMPTASSTNVGQIVQYTGTTNASYTNGYFYKCVEDSSTTPSTYSWESITLSNPTINSFYLSRTSVLGTNIGSSTFSINSDDLADYNALCLKVGRFLPLALRMNVFGRPLILYPITANGDLLFSGCGYDEGGYLYRATTNSNISNPVVGNLPTFQFWRVCHRILPTDNTTSYTPTGDYNPATKKYVDDQVGSINTVLATLTTPSNNGGN